MPSVPEFDVDLDLPPQMRWDGLVESRAVARKMVRFYLRDLGGMEALSTMGSGSFADYCAAYIEEEYRAEMRGVARALDMSEDEVVLANLYYDAMKLIFSGAMGCTAFAVDAPAGPLHARNLDWMSSEGHLASESTIFNFRRRGELLYRTVGWPGFVGCFSGVACGRFAVTLNAAHSEDPPSLAAPIAFTLRRVLESCLTFADALTALCSTELVSDALLLLTGIDPGQMAVIERTPTRAAVRQGDAGSVFVTNDYRALSPRSKGPPAGIGLTGGGGTLARTSCARYDRAQTLVRMSPPYDAGGCMNVLRHGGVKMDITVQHLVISPRTGAILLERPS